MSGAPGLSRPRLGLTLVVLVCSVFALRALALINATGLWSDELYYSLVWIWGQQLSGSAVTLRLLSWLAYLAGGLLITAQAGALVSRLPMARRQLAVAAAALMAFCSPYPVRFAVEGKGYALLVFLVALALWWRQRHQWLGYGFSMVLAALTHYYGLFLFAVVAVWDGWRGRRRASLVVAAGLVPALLWMLQASAYLMRSGTAAWIGWPDFALLEDTLARGLGLWPLPKLGLLLLVLSWWWHSFRELDPAVNGHGAREVDQFQLVSRALAAEPHRFFRLERLFNLSDRMELAAGRMAELEGPWGRASELDQLLASSALPAQIWLADSGDIEGSWPRLKALRRRAEAAGYRCQKAAIAGSEAAPYAHVQQCQLEASLHSVRR